MATKGFIAQVGIEGYDAHSTVVDLLVMHTDKVTAPLSVNMRDFLILYKETSRLTTIPTPTVSHSMMGVIDEINGVATATTVQDDTASTEAMAAAAAAVRAAKTAARIASAEKEVTTAAAQLELAKAISQQVRDIAERWHSKETTGRRVSTVHNAISPRPSTRLKLWRQTKEQWWRRSPTASWISRRPPRAVSRLAPAPMQ